MLRKILLVMNLIFILSMGVVCAAERTYEVTDGGCIVSLPEQYAVTVVERPTDPNDELGVRVAQLSISDPVNKSMTMHVMVESSKLTKELPDLNYRPGGVMKDYFAENLQNSGWQEPVVAGELQNGKMYFIKFSSYIADSVGQKYDGQIYATLKNGNLIYLMIMSKERALTADEKTFLETTVKNLQFKDTVLVNTNAQNK